MKTIIEPFRIRTIEPLRMTTAAERQLALERAHYNLFGLRARDVHRADAPNFQLT